MANPYSQYQGTRISPVPSGFLTATGQVASNLQKGIAGIGSEIGEGLAKYYEKKDEEEEKERKAKHAADFYSQFAEPKAPSEADLSYLKNLPGYDPTKGPPPRGEFEPLPDYEKRVSGEPINPTQILADFVSGTPDLDPSEIQQYAAYASKFTKEQLEKKHTEAQIRNLDMPKAGAGKNPKLEIWNHLEPILQKEGTPPEEIKRQRGMILGSAKTDPTDTKTSDQKNWAKIEPDLLKRLKKDPTYGNKEFAAQYDEFWGLTPPAGTTSDLEIKFDKLDVMLASGYLTPEEHTQAMLEAMKARVAPVEPTTKMQEYEYFKNLLDPALHDRFTRETAGLTPTEVEKKKDVVTWLTGTGVTEGDAVRMSMGRDISSVTQAQQHIALLKSIEEKFELGELTREEAEMQAFATNEFAGIPTAGDLKSQRLSNELKQKELEKEAKLLEALQDPSSKPEMMDTPLPNYKYMRKPPSTNWTLVNISEGGAKITRQVSKKMADKLNIDLDKQGSQYRWQFDATDPRTGGSYMYKPMGAYGGPFARPPKYKPEDRFVPPEEIPTTQEASPAATPPGAVVIPLEELTTEAKDNVSKMKIDQQFNMGGKLYKKVENGITEIK